MAIRTTLVCTHCGGAFSVTLPTDGSGIGSCSKQHTGLGGCGKNTKVHYTKGVVDRTQKG